MKVALHSTPSAYALMPVLTKVYEWSTQRRLAKDYLTPENRVETAHLSMQAHIGEHELESGDTAGQQLLLKLIPRAV